MPTRRIASPPASLPDRLVRDAVGCLQSGRLDDARRHFLAILAVDPKHFVALHLLGVTEAQLGRAEMAINLLELALEQNPRSPDALNNLGMVLHGLGREQDAVTRYREALAVAPNYAIAHNNLGIALSALGRRNDAVEAFRKALAIKPDYAEALNNLGTESFAAGQYQQALTWLSRAAAARPDYPEAALNIGKTRAALGQYHQAVAHFEQALALRPDLAGAALGLGSVLNVLQRYRDAIPRLEQALAQTPDDADVALNLGIALAGLDRHGEAVAQCERALRLKPDFADAEIQLGATLVALRRHDEAVQHLTRALSLRPDDADVEMHLGLAYAAVRRHEQATAHYRRAIELRPTHGEAQVNLARSLRALDRQDEAIALLEAAIANNPGLAQAHDNLGVALAEAGRIDDACRALDTAIALDSRQPSFFLNRLNAAGLAPDSPHRAAMDALAAEMDALAQSDQISLHFALGNALAGTGNDQAAFDHLLRGNAMQRRKVTYDEAAALGRFEHTKQVFTPELMERLRGGGDPSSLPIFILGMPRSGSTLVEQILASHPKVFAGGERLDFREAMRDTEIDGRSLRFPTDVPDLGPTRLGDLGATYVARLRAAEQRMRRVGNETAAAERITDKMPANFRFAGLLALALPNARIIHTCRDPLDTCLSCFSILFAGTQPFAYDLGELGRYYRGYAGLMAHWRRVLPQGTMLDVRYESLVGNFAAETARILQHCGLEWDDRCLAFHRTDRPVRTSSMSQVRQPLYGRAIGRWRLSETTLRPLLDGLGIGSAPGSAGGTAPACPVLE